VDQSQDEELDVQIEKCGFKLSDVKMVIMGHLHMDHSGGLVQFRRTKTRILVHELELKNAFYSVATGYDLGVYMAHYLTFDLNWQTWTGATFDVAQGITLRHMPGHTPGLSIMQVNLSQSGTWIVTTDMYIVKENFEENLPLGFLARDHNPWCHSNQLIHQLQRRTKAKMLFGHCADTLAKYQLTPHAYE
jgi:glyoxylase-like metal-dependent hydrolase (beta-lactamase superfamily II)